MTGFTSARSPVSVSALADFRRRDVSVGASAPIFGLLGALVHYGRRTGNSHVRQAGLQYALFMGIFGLIFPGVDNWAHAGGFAGGWLASLVLDPLKPGTDRSHGRGASAASG